jgi:hypothetical protein
LGEASAHDASLSIMGDCREPAPHCLALILETAVM